MARKKAAQADSQSSVAIPFIGQEPDEVPAIVRLWMLRILVPMGKFS